MKINVKAKPSSREEKVEKIDEKSCIRSELTAESIQRGGTFFMRLQNN